jgi:hypothetical protein
MRWIAPIAVAAAGSVASAQFESINSNAIGLRYFADIPASSVQVTQNSYPGILQFQEDFPVRPPGQTGANRHIGVLSADNGMNPFIVPHNTAWYYQATVRMTGTASNEVGLHIGGIGTNWPPGNLNADTGVLMVNANSGEIAAFGGWLPFFSTFDPVFSYMGHGQRDQDFRLAILVRPLSPTSITAEYFVDGHSTGPLALDSGAVQAYYSLNNIASVYAQNSWIPAGPSSATSTFTNFVIAPAPGTIVLIGAGCAVFSRRARPGGRSS